MTDDRVSSTKMRPHFDEVQAHYDMSDDFSGCFRSVANLQLRVLRTRGHDA